MSINKNILLSFYISISLLLVWSTQALAAEVHALLIADTMGGEHMFEDNMDLMHREAKRIAAYTNLPLHMTIFEDYEVRIDNVIDYINKMDVQPDDIIFFYANIHGGRLQNKNNKWPNLLFRFDAGIKSSRSEIDFSEFSELLKNKNPSLLLSIAEACNSVDLNLIQFDEDEEALSEEEERLLAQYISSLAKGPSQEYHLDSDDFALEKLRNRTEDEEIECYKKLFIDTQGSILISSSSPGEVAISGLFTPSFLDSLSFAAHFGYYDSQGWDDILERTSQKVHKKFALLENHEMLKQKSQTIQYELNLNYTH